MARTKNVYAPLHHLPFSMLSVHNLFLSEPYLCTLKYFSERIVLGHSALARLPSCLNFKTLTDESMNFSSEKVYLHHYLSRRCRWTTVSATLFSQNRDCAPYFSKEYFCMVLPCSAFGRLVLVSTSRTCRMKLLFAEKCMCIPSDRRMRFNAKILLAWMLRYLWQNIILILCVYIYIDVVSCNKVVWQHNKYDQIS